MNDRIHLSYPNNFPVLTEVGFLKLGTLSIKYIGIEEKQNSIQSYCRRKQKKWIITSQLIKIVSSALPKTWRRKTIAQNSIFNYFKRASEDCKKNFQELGFQIPRPEVDIAKKEIPWYLNNLRKKKEKDKTILEMKTKIEGASESVHLNVKI